MREKYCTLPKELCECIIGEKADCENCPQNKRFIERTIDNWESYITDMETFEEYGNNINKIIDLLNKLSEENRQLKKENKMLKVTIMRNEGYIRRIKSIGKWSNNSDAE